jgi:hypothetical protein
LTGEDQISIELSLKEKRAAMAESLKKALEGALLAQAGRKIFFGRTCCGSSQQPSSFVNIEFYQPFASHFQQQGLAGFLIHDVGAFHDLIDLERLLAECAQDIRSVIQHD